MASKKGVLLTVGILTAITAASFLVWLLPENREAVFVITDFENYLDGVNEIHMIIIENVEEEFEKLLDKEITPEQYNQFAEVATSQINSQLIQLVKSEPPEEWEQSYENYIESLKQFNSYIRESIVISKMIEGGASQNELDEAIQNMERYRINMIAKIEQSNSLRP